MIETECWESKVQRSAELWGLDLTVVCLRFEVIWQSPHCHLLSPSLSLVLWVSGIFLFFFVTGCVCLPLCLFLSLPVSIWAEWSGSSFCWLPKAYCNCAPSSSWSYFSVHFIENGGTCIILDSMNTVQCWNNGTIKPDSACASIASFVCSWQAVN